MAKKLSSDLKKNRKEVIDFTKTKLPDFILDKSQDLVDESFSKEQYQDGKSKKWKGRKKDKQGSKERTERRALLVEGGDLIKSTEATKSGSKVIISSDVDYAQIHNEGLKGKAFGKHSFKMPKRQFMPIEGEAPPFEDEVEKMIDDEMNKIFK